jgi:II/X family phage/plasmid replication protein
MNLGLVMLDKLEINIPFHRDYVNVSEQDKSFHHAKKFSSSYLTSDDFCFVDLRFLDNETSARTIHFEDGYPRVSDLYCPWESLPSSFSGMALKVYHMGCGKQNWPFVQLKCSPVKLLQGHNVCGDVSFFQAFKNMAALLNETYPVLFCKLDLDNTEIVSFDINYSLKIENRKIRESLMRYFQSMELSRVKTNAKYESTCYYGSPKSTRKSIKIYLKGLELERDKKSLEFVDTNVLALSEHLVRFELTVKKQYLKDRNIPLRIKDFLYYFKNVDLFEFWKMGMSDFFNCLDGDIVTTDDDKIKNILNNYHGHVRGRVSKLFSLIQSIKMLGFDLVRSQYPSSTFRRMLSQLHDCGFSRSYLQHLNVNSFNNVIPIVRVVDISNFSDYSDYEIEDLKFA